MYQSSKKVLKYKVRKREDTQGKLSQWNLIIKEYGLEMNMDKINEKQMQIPRNRHEILKKC
jgi:hypothetical protein